LWLSSSLAVVHKPEVILPEVGYLSSVDLSLIDSQRWLRPINKKGPVAEATGP
jgi:hypothetical protein